VGKAMLYDADALITVRSFLQVD